VATIYTIGHSTRTLDELIAALHAHGIGTLVDIRAFPMSRRLPHFNRESLERELPKQGIEYVWMKELGGRRKKILDDSPNTGLRNDSFRNYADYMLTPQFAEAIARLLKIAEPTPSPKEGETPALNLTKKTAGPPAAPPPGSPTTRVGEDADAPLGITNLEGAANAAIMCAERVYFHCHRMLVSDYLVAHGHTVLHIDDDKHPPRPHKLMAEAHMVNGQLLYNAQELF